MESQKTSFRVGDKIRYKPKNVLCKCLTIDKIGDIIYVLGQDLSNKEAKVYLRYTLDDWEKV
jgi:hypothetical protein